ncbi:hypothetical protein [Umezakia ovalisporum]|uniref:hypothetical protein n=1 Tax=Umezakia ovalisporum TaxID=75695 RepID=UPI0035B841CB
MVINFYEKTGFSPQSINQHIAVSFTYQVYFTKNLFDLKNPILAQVVSAHGETNPKKLIAVVDEGLLKFQPALLQELETYTKFYAETQKC